MPFHVKGEQGPASIWNDKVINCPDKKHVVSIGYLCGRLVLGDIKSHPNILVECIRILELIQVLSQTSLKISVLFSLNKNWSAALFEFLVAVAWALLIGSGLMIYIS